LACAATASIVTAAPLRRIDFLLFLSNAFPLSGVRWRVSDAAASARNPDEPRSVRKVTERSLC
jgi:hypothetical protein